MTLSEADTCRKYVVPKLQAAGWDNEPHSIAEQRTITDGRIVPVGKGFVRKPPEARGLPAPLHARLPARRRRGQGRVQDGRRRPAAGQGVRRDARPEVRLRHQRPRDHRVRLLHRASRRDVDDYPDARRTLAALPRRRADLHRRSRRPTAHARSITRSARASATTSRSPINRTVEAILKGQRRVLLTMATGTGKTVVAFQICWKLWNARWNRTGEHRTPAILYLADRNILVDRPEGQDLRRLRRRPLQDRGGEVVKSREMYFAIYQALAEDERRPASSRSIAPDFFDLIIVDECHRGSARDESSLARDPRVLRAGLPARHDRHAAARRQPRHLPLLRQSDLHLQPAAGHRGRLPRALPRPSRRHRVGRRRLAAEQGRARPLRPRDPRRRVPDQGFRARRRPARAHRGHRPAPHRVPEEDRPLRQDHRLLRRSGARRRDARGAEQPERRPRRSSIPTTSAASPPTKATSAAATSAASRTSRRRRR